MRETNMRKQQIDGDAQKTTNRRFGISAGRSDRRRWRGTGVKIRKQKLNTSQEKRAECEPNTPSIYKIYRAGREYEWNDNARSGVEKRHLMCDILQVRQ